jgi:hypothetical protein
MCFHKVQLHHVTQNYDFGFSLIGDRVWFTEQHMGQNETRREHVLVNLTASQGTQVKHH